MRALPHAYRDIESDVGTCVAIEVDAEGGGVWALRRDESGWGIYQGKAGSPAASIRVDSDTAWKVLYNALSAEDGRSRARIEGDEAFVSTFFGTRSVMV